MLKNDIGIDAGLIWRLLSENKVLSIREIGEFSGYRDSMIFLALGWLARENKVSFKDNNGTLYIELNNTLTELYY
ncbi:MAG TPA: winged helix-turn-helix domain-containing protein [Dysgonomonas sp.]|uniref:winged helix-turn-helix domain-containing protein n=1 Tax=unclassified Dysgonomonas TaxID=2630389 RepID=UPI0025C295DC|nr:MULTISPECIES: winged helix-turn-helix domain-containing protein [unclassified Dysgonomonas]HML64790.1 winged helix-turn-helix domain-containing protein [Dysgonomonas sp.]